MSIDKALNPAPMGLDELAEGLGEPDIEIEIEDPEEVKIKMGDLEIEFEPRQETEDDFNANLADFIFFLLLSFHHLFPSFGTQCCFLISIKQRSHLIIYGKIWHSM